jgi:hypothetical protein
LSKNTRWALALIGVVIIIVGAVVIGTGKDNTDAVQEPKTESTAETGGATQSTPTTPQTGSTGTDDNGGGSPAPDNGGDSGGASPDDSGESGGASPGNTDDSSGGASASSAIISPVLTAGKSQTIKVDKGDYLVIRAKSSGSGEVHVHGYDKEVPLKPGETVRIKLKATIDGEFPIEFHLAGGAHADVGVLRVNP